MGLLPLVVCGSSTMLYAGQSLCLIQVKTTQRSIAMTAYHDISMKSISGEDVDFSDYRGQLCLLVNVASQ
jgi:hypothetical protein